MSAAGFESGQWCDYYELLGVPFDAPFEQIQRVYKQQMVAWHSDSPSGSHSDRMTLLNLARETLRDRRQQFDLNRAMIRKKAGMLTTKVSPSPSEEPMMDSNAEVETGFSNTERFPILPCYLLFDTSGSMGLGTAPNRPIDVANGALPELLELVRSDPMTAEIARFGLVSFDGTARTLLPLSDLRRSKLPDLEASGSTNYVAAFNETASAIRRDLKQLGSGTPFYTPVVWMFTDGLPNDDDWVSAHKQLASPGDGDKYHAYVVAYGFGEANPEVIRQVGTAAALMAREAPTHEQLRAVIKSLVGSIKRTSGELGEQAPQPTDGQSSSLIIDNSGKNFIDLKLHHAN